MVSEVLVREFEGAVFSYVSYSGAARERGHTVAKSKHIVALTTCIFFLVVSLALAIWFGYQGNVWLSIAALGPFFASFTAVLCVKAKITK